MTCDGCLSWFHVTCVGLQTAPPLNEFWHCATCRAAETMAAAEEEALAEAEAAEEMDVYGEDLASDDDGGGLSEYGSSSVAGDDASDSAEGESE